MLTYFERAYSPGRIECIAWARMHDADVTSTLSRCMPCGGRTICPRLPTTEKVRHRIALDRWHVSPLHRSPLQCCIHSWAWIQSRGVDGCAGSRRHNLPPLGHQRRHPGSLLRSVLRCLHCANPSVQFCCVPAAVGQETALDRGRQRRCGDGDGAGRHDVLGQERCLTCADPSRQGRFGAFDSTASPKVHLADRQNHPWPRLDSRVSETGLVWTAGGQVQGQA